MSKKALKNGHAQHIHANCRCTYAIRFSEETDIQGYDPDKYYQEYVEAGRDVNQMRTDMYHNNKEYAEKIKAQKREAYAKRKRHSSKKEEILTGSDIRIIYNHKRNEIVTVFMPRIIDQSKRRY